MLKYSDLYNYNAYASPRKDASIDIVIDIRKSASEVEPLTKSVTVSDDPATVTGIKFTKSYNASIEEETLNPTGTKFNGITVDAGYDAGWSAHPSTKIVPICSKEWAHPDTLVVYATDQYGRPITADIEFTVADIKEADTDLTHVPNNFVVSKNGTAEANIEGAEIGDTFKLTAKVKGQNITDSITIKVGADKDAYIDQNGSGSKAVKDPATGAVTRQGSKDLGLRELFGYDR